MKKNLVWAGATVFRKDGGLILTLPVPPSGNAAYRAVPGRVISSPEWKAYQKAIDIFAMTKRIKKFDAPQEIGLTIRWYRERKSGDLTNREKTIEDALQGVAYDNDAQVRQKQSQRFDDYWGPPRIEVEVHPAPDGDPEGTAGS
jgi:hypothetical protein